MKPIQKTAKTAGLLYLLQIPLGVFGLVYVTKTLLIPNDVSATASNILANEFLFRASIVSALLAALVTVFTALYLYEVLKSVDKYIAKLMVLFTVIVAPISMINELNNVAVLLILKGLNQSQSMIQLFLDLHKYGIQVAGIFFGLWLLPMGYLVFKSGFMPKIIGVFLIITSVGYVIDFFTFFLFPNFALFVSEYTWLGEVMMVLWLLIKGVDVKKWEALSRETSKNE